MASLVGPWQQVMSAQDAQVVLACLRALVEGPFVQDDGEFHTVMGLWRQDVREMLVQWPAAEDLDDQWLVVNNALNTLLSYPHHQEGAWDRWVPRDRDQVEELFRRLREASGDAAEGRDELTAWMQEWSTRSDDVLAEALGTVREVVALARREGLDVPQRLLQLLDEHAGRPDPPIQ